MAMIGARVAALGLALAVFCSSQQACAFGLRLGPFLFGVRAHHHHHYRYVVRRPTEALRRPTEAVRRPTEGLHPKATPTDDVAQNHCRACRLYLPGRATLWRMQGIYAGDARLARQPLDPAHGALH